MPNPSIVARIVSEISAFIQTTVRTDIDRSTRLVILIKNIYTLWGRKRFRYILSDKSSIPFYSTSNGYNNHLDHSDSSCAYKAPPSPMSTEYILFYFICQYLSTCQKVATLEFKSPFRKFSTFIN